MAKRLCNGKKGRGLQEGEKEKSKGPFGLQCEGKAGKPTNPLDSTY